MLCSFGSCDLDVYDDCNNDFKNVSELGWSYETPKPEDRYALAGFKYFKVLEMEVY